MPNYVCCCSVGKDSSIGSSPCHRVLSVSKYSNFMSFYSPLTLISVWSKYRLKDRRWRSCKRWQCYDFVDNDFIVRLLSIFWCTYLMHKATTCFLRVCLLYDNILRLLFCKVSRDEIVKTVLYAVQTEFMCSQKCALQKKMFSCSLSDNLKVDLRIWSKFFKQCMRSFGILLCLRKLSLDHLKLGSL